jgi:uncharacterized protein (DUF1330 family)
MKAKTTSSIALLGGIVIGIAGTAVIHAQQTTTAPAYIIAEVETDPGRKPDPTASRKYAKEAPKSLAAFDGRYLVRGVKAETLEGEVSTGAIVVIGFESVEKARAWYHSPAYEALKPIRQNSTKSRLLLVEGIAPKS